MPLDLPYTRFDYSSGKFREWSKDLAAFLGREFNMALLPKAQSSLLAMSDYFMWIIKRNRDKSTENLLGALLKLQKEQPDLDDFVLAANCSALVFAGHETTTNLISTALYLLFGDQQLLTIIKKDRSLIAPFLDEVLRLESPMQRLSRLVNTSFTYKDITFEAGQEIFLLVGAGNRDDEIFENPSSLMLDRDVCKHLSFGFDRHLCPGAQLSKIEAQMAVNSFLELDSVQLVTKNIKWQRNLSLRGLVTLPAVFV